MNLPSDWSVVELFVSEGQLDPIVASKHCSSTVKHPASVIVWGCFSGYRAEDLFGFCQGRDDELHHLPEVPGGEADPLPGDPWHHQVPAGWRTMPQVQEGNGLPGDKEDVVD